MNIIKEVKAFGFLALVEKTGNYFKYLWWSWCTIPGYRTTKAIGALNLYGVFKCRLSGVRHSLFNLLRLPYDAFTIFPKLEKECFEKFEEKQEEEEENWWLSCMKK